MELFLTGEERDTVLLRKHFSLGAHMTVRDFIFAFLDELWSEIERKGPGLKDQLFGPFARPYIESQQEDLSF